MPSHLEKNLQRAIDQMHDKVVEMGELVQRALTDSVEAIRQSNRQLAYGVILKDRYIDELEEEIELLCQRFLIRHLPAGRHMRFVYSIIKINSELERVGDYAKAIARRFLLVNSLDAHASYPKIVDIANLAVPLLRNALQALDSQNATLAKATREKEKEKTIDNLRYEAHQELVKLHEDGLLPSEALVPLVTIVGRLERVANQAGNICEEVLYMCTGEDLRHEDYHRVLRVLFVDVGDSCRAQMAEGIGNSLGLERIHFSSAGIDPRPVDARTVKFMAEKGIDISSQTSKHFNEILDLKEYEAVVSLCAEATKAFPSTPKLVRIEWEVDNPSKLRGTEEEVRAAYERAFRYLDTHIRDLIEAILDNRNKREEGSDED